MSSDESSSVDGGVIGSESWLRSVRAFGRVLDAEGRSSEDGCCPFGIGGRSLEFDGDAIGFRVKAGPEFGVNLGSGCAYALFNI